MIWPGSAQPLTADNGTEQAAWCCVVPLRGAVLVHMYVYEYLHRTYRADPAHADDSEHPVFGIMRRLESALPVAITDVDLGAIELPERRYGEEGASRRRCVVDGFGRVADLYSPCSTRVDVDYDPA